MIKANRKKWLPYIGLPIIIAALILLHAGRVDTFVLLRRLTISAFGYIASVDDIKAKRIPNRLILQMLLAWVILFAPTLIYYTDAAVSLLFESLLGFLIGGGLFLLVYLISRKGLGGGDVKFMAAAGLYLGFSGALSAILCGAILAGLTGLILLLLKKLGRKDSMPLAPFLYVGILITVFSV